MSLRFSHRSLSQQVLFGSGQAAEHLAAEVARLGAQRVMVIASPRERRLAERVCARIDVTVWHDGVAEHVPVHVAERGRAVAAERAADLLVSVGGGSTTGLAKAVALTTGLPIVAVPTTYAGSEATNVWGMTEDATKTTGVDDRVLPGTVIYDAELTLSLPVPLSVASGLNGLAHCVDSMWAPRADPINRALAAEGIRALATGLPRVITDPAGLPGREHALYGAYLAAVAFASAGSGLHHKICHVLGGTFDLPHAETHATVLPYVLAYNAPFAPGAAARIAQALGRPADPDEPRAAAEAAVAGLSELRARLGAPTALRDYGLAAEDIPDAVARVLRAAPPSNPRPVSEENLTALLTAAWSGATPSVDPDIPAAPLVPATEAR
ncbi:maleylacetate reductase [Georgenia sp. AZ-5]|uniref:maleylacetate reductase n=1 Tax=Georgenia sp. AZ-5 TaxID=3367526 RepID=UPI0037542E18